LAKNPFDLHGSSSGGFDLGSTPLDLSAPGTKLTLSQALKIRDAKKKGRSESFWDRVKHGGGHVLHPIEWTFDKILRPAYGMAAGSMAIAKDPVLHAHQGHFSLHNAIHDLPRALSDFEKGFGKGFTGKEKHGYGQVIEQAGYLKGHRRLRGLAGFAADVGLDPLSYVSGGTTIYAGSAEHAARIAAGRRAIRDAAGTMFAKHPQDLDKIIKGVKTDASVLKKAGDGYTSRRTLAEEQLRHLEASKNNVVLGEQDMSQLRRLSAAAHAEERRVEQFLPHFRMGGTQITPTTIGGRKLAPALPKLDNYIEKQLPFHRAASRFREMFIRGVGQTPEVHAITMGQKHQMEELTAEHLGFIRRRFEGVKTPKTRRQQEILHHFERPEKGWKAVVKHNGVFHVNENYINHLMKKGVLNEHEANWVRAYQDSMERLFVFDKKFGVRVTHFAEGAKTKGHMYVPHLMDRSKSGEVLSDAMRKLTTVAGFERKRAERQLSLKQLVDLVGEGKLPKEVIQDPYELLVSRARASSRRQSELTSLAAITKIGGVPTRLVDTAKLDKNRARQVEAGRMIEQFQAEHDQHIANHNGVERWLLNNHEAKFNRDMEAIQREVRKVKYGKKFRTKNAQLANLQKRLDKRQAIHADEVNKISKGRFAPLNAELNPHKVWAAAAYEDMTKLKTEVKQLVKEEKVILAGKKNPAYSKSLHTITPSGAKDEFGHPIAFTHELGQAVDKVHRVSEGDDQAVKAFEEFYRKGMSKWKLMVTSINPGYRVRNTSTDLWNWWLKPGVNPASGALYLTKATNLLRQLKNIDTKLAKESLSDSERAQLQKALIDYRDMYQHGVLSGLFQGDVQAITEMIKYAGSKKALASRGHMIRLYTKVAQDVNRTGENWVRVAHYLWARDKGLSPVEASFSVKSAHFDYEDLTPFEQRRMKAIAPFYTWTRKNIPYQVKQIIASPGKYAAFPKAAQEGEYSAGSDQGNIVPGYVADAFGFHVPIGHHNYLLPQLGVSDLQALDSPGGAVQRLTGLVSPAFRIPAELEANKNFFTGAQIAPDTHSRQKISPLGAALLSLLPGSNVGTTTRLGAGGRHITGPGANPKYVYALSQLGPLGNLLFQKSGGISTKQGAPSPLWSYAGGVSLAHLDPKLQEIYASMNLDAEVKKDMADLRDEGIIPQAKRKRGKRGRYVDQQLLNLLGRG
jgi:hypothetical protein